jgi:hypothetical protein
VIHATVFTRALDRDDVGRFLDDADLRALSSRVAAVVTELLFRDVEAQATQPHLVLCFDDRVSKRSRVLGADL